MQNFLKWFGVLETETFLHLAPFVAVTMPAEKPGRGVQLRGRHIFPE
jgi:hypothetical protein